MDHSDHEIDPLTVPFRVSFTFTVPNYYTKPDQLIYLGTALEGLERVPMKFTGGAWSVALDITDFVPAIVADYERYGTYRYFVVEEARTYQDVLERKMPHLPDLGVVRTTIFASLALKGVKFTAEMGEHFVLNLEFIDDWSFNRSVGWYSDAFDVILGYHLKEHRSLLDECFATRFLSSSFYTRKVDSIVYIELDPDVVHLPDGDASAAGAPQVPGGAPAGALGAPGTPGTPGPRVRKVVQSSRTVEKYVKAALHFSVQVPYIYKGERVFMVGNLPRFGEWDARNPRAVELHHVGARRFECRTVLHLTEDEVNILEYKFCIDHGNGQLTMEGGDNRRVVRRDNLLSFNRLPVPCPADRVGCAPDSCLHEKLFTIEPSAERAFMYGHARTPEAIAVDLSNTPALIATEPDSALSEEAAQCRLSKMTLNTVAGGAAGGTGGADSPDDETDGGEDACVFAPGRGAGSEPGPRGINVFSYLVHSFFKYPYDSKPRFTCVNVPVFSLTSSMSCGCGEFADLELLGDFCAQAGLHMVSILPVNDNITSRFDKSTNPYAPISFFALHPLYIRVSDVDMHDPVLQTELLRRFIQVKSYLNKNNTRVTFNYNLVINRKLELLRFAYDRLVEVDGETLHNEIASWINGSAEVRFFIYSYALYKYYNRLHDRVRPADWPLETHGPDGRPHRGLGVDAAGRPAIADFRAYAESLCAVDAARRDEIFFYVWLQYVAHTQFRRASQHLKALGIALKGDAQYSINAHSCECWAYPQYFNAGFSTGAPPDYFSTFGQNWGTPTFNWDAIARDGYAWVVHRFRYLGAFFSAVRLDHVLGWFRVWEIPSACCPENGRLGWFSPAKRVDYDWLDVYVDPASPTEYCRSKEALLARLTQPLLEKKAVHALLGRSDGDLTAEDLVDIGILRYDTGRKTAFRGYVIALSERDGYDVLKSCRAAGELSEELYRLLLSSFIKLLSNKCLQPDPRDPDRFHPLLINADASYESTSLTTLEVPGLRNDLRRWSYEYFNTWHGDLWMRIAKERFNVLQECSNMLLFGEDLGYLHECVGRTMFDCGILGLRVQRLPCRNYGGEFYNCSDEYNYSYLTDCTPSTHDNQPLRVWWADEANRYAVCKFWREQLNRPWDTSNSAVSRELTAYDARNIMRQHLHSKSMFATFLLQDLFAIDDKLKYKGKEQQCEVINDPASSRHELNWRYRMHVFIEELIDSGFGGDICGEIQASGRYV